MSWESEDGEHEGYVLPEFADGVRGRGIWTGKVPSDHVVVDVEYIGEPGAITEERYASRPAAEVVGWRVMCDCRTAPGSSRVTNQWVSELVTRVPSQALVANPPSDSVCLYVPDDDVPVVDELFHAVFLPIWRHQHVVAASALAAITQARQAIDAAERDLDRAVLAARAAGETWDAVGRAAGMKRQSAHQRWSGQA